MLDLAGYQNDLCTAFENEIATGNLPAMQALQELVTNLPDTLVDDVMDDLDEYELTGIVSSRIEIVLKRTICLIQADRIAAHI